MASGYIMASGFLFLGMLLEIIRYDFRNIKHAMQYHIGDFKAKDVKREKRKPKGLCEMIDFFVARGSKLVKTCWVIIVVTAITSLAVSRLSPILELPDISREILLTGYGVTVTIMVFIHHIAVQAWDLIKWSRECRLFELLLTKSDDCL